MQNEEKRITRKKHFTYEYGKTIKKKKKNKRDSSFSRYKA